MHKEIILAKAWAQFLFCTLRGFLKVWRSFVCNYKVKLAVYSVIVAIVTVQWLAISSSSRSFWYL